MPPTPDDANETWPAAMTGLAETPGSPWKLVDGRLRLAGTESELAGR